MENKTKEIYMYWFNQYKENLESGNIDNWIEKVKIKYSISTQKVIAASMKYFCDKTFLVEHNKNRLVHSINVISEKEYKTIYDSIIMENYTLSIRNKLILRVLWETGMRVGELINLKWSDISDVYIKIIGKGRMERMVPYKKDLFINLNQENIYVFSIKGNKMSYSTIYKQFQEYKKAINRKRLSPHVLRHSFASRLIGKNIPIEFLSRLMGHASIQTTMIYIHFNEKNIIDFLQKI
ncbi:tyrosine-type recombinase/integrase [Candidatus Mycoplasma mahonii]|uniref:tyrosine-type recombinase/integrase n=1 Tax=Candidatus Mycoplasma mahonii TaxID=3004105 RepID=UPI0026EB80D1|nr:site-specific integrase [Candidatus Mycoplasma mahonii]WKX02776.1 site-specific integrase [Candidatus Mycoplasma mahonii]